MMPKSKLTNEMIEKLAQYVRSGTYNAVAAENVGIDESTYYRWLRLAEKAKSGMPFQLYQSIKKARADAETERVAKIREYGMGTRAVHRWTVTRANGDVEQHEEYGTGNWQALAWLLERQYPERWAKTERLQLSDPSGKPLQPFVIVAPNNQPLIYPHGNGHNADEAAKLLGTGPPPDASQN